MQQKILAGRSHQFMTRMLGGMALCALSVSAFADDHEGRAYVSPMAGYFFADDDRVADDGAGGALAVGIEASKLFNVELELAGDNMDKDTSAGGVEDFKQFSAAVNGLLVFARDSLISPYLLVGGGILNTDASTDEAASAMGQAGLGAFINVSDNFALRVDGRYRLDDNDGDFYSQSKFEDYVAMLGITWRFGGEKAAPAAVTAAAVVPPPPRDTDGDGVPDSSDKCPNTDAGAKVDSVGCTIVADTDGDGVPDEKDLCPNTPAGVEVTATGCSEAAILHGVTFKTDSAELLPSSKETLDKAGRILRDDPAIKVYLDGHTDSQGAAAFNKTLSERRATSVKNYFVSELGIDASRLVVRGFGEEYPIADNKTAAGRAQNRRVELNPIKE